MRRVRSTLALLAAAAGAGGFLFAWSGLYDVSASRGHWAITQRMLTFGMERSVRRHAADVVVPPLGDPALLYLGMAHYDGGCAPCHGAPGEPRNAIPVKTVPKPPFLAAGMPQWTTRELFWITKNGLKYTGMPAWPAAERDDEVWAVVAALSRLPATSVDEYRRLVRGETLAAVAEVEEDARLLVTAGSIGQDLVACARCHGLRGDGRGTGAFPRLAGQREAYLYLALREYASGVRPSGIMQPVSSELSAADMRALARHYANLPLPAGTRPALAAGGAAAARRGEALARSGSAAAGIPACAACHGPVPWERHPLYPTLAGQPVFYLEQQLRLWRAGARSRTSLARVMHAAARPLTDVHIRELALYYSQLPPAEGSR